MEDGGEIARKSIYGPYGGEAREVKMRATLGWRGERGRGSRMIHRTVCIDTMSHES